APIRGATVELWQASANGSYDRSGRARVITNRTGTFRFEGPVPGSELGRRPHIHVHVIAPGYPDFVTTYFVARGERRGSIRIVLVSDLWLENRFTSARCDMAGDIPPTWP